MDLDAFYGRYEGDVADASIRSRMMSKVLIYGYASGVFFFAQDCPQAERGYCLSGALGEQLPAHRTIREFRQLHLQEFSALFRAGGPRVSEAGCTGRSRETKR